MSEREDERADVLVVDVRELVGESFVAVSTAHAALAAAERREWALVIVDRGVADALATVAALRRRAPCILHYREAPASPEEAYTAGAVDVFVAPVADAMLRAKVGVFRDLLERRRQLASELEEAKRANKELGDAGALLRNLVNHLPELAWSARPDGFIDFYNKKWFDFTGTTMAQMEGWGWQSVHHPDHLAEVTERWQASIATGLPFEMEFPLRRADGTFHWFLTRVEPVRDASGRIVNWVGTNVDIDDQRHAARRAEDANRAKDEFLATASHELRTPLNAILGWAQLLRAGELAPSVQLRGIDTIERNAKAQVRLIEDILDGSRIITGNLRLEVRSLDLSVVVGAALDAIRQAADAKGIVLSTFIDPDATRMIGDPERLQQVIWNLVTNAVKFTPRGGTVDVRVEREGTHIQIAVTDSGEGIKQDFLPFVFDRFRQAEETTTRRFGGLGLGLALVRHLAEAHGGAVRAESEGAGRGSRFVVLLPVQAVHAAAPEPLPSSGPVSFGLVVDAPESANLHGVTVLVVDDEPDARDLIATALRGAGGDVFTAANAAHAQKLFAAHKPAVILSDIGMPEVDGYELLRRLRTSVPETEPVTPAIALTAYAREKDRRLALVAGFQTHLSKPVEPAELVRVVASLVGFVASQTSSTRRAAALVRADAYLTLEKILAAQGVLAALRFLNERTSHRFTGLYRFDAPVLRSVHLVDAETPALTRGTDAPLEETYCSIVGETSRAFATADAGRDERLLTHPARAVVRSYTGSLLRTRTGEGFGTLCHFDLVPCDVPDSDLPLLEAAAALFGRALAP